MRSNCEPSRKIFINPFHRSHGYYETIQDIQNLKHLIGAKRRERERDLRSLPSRPFSFLLYFVVSFLLYFVVSFLILFNSLSFSARGNSLRKHNKISVEKTTGGAQDAEWNFLVSSRQKLSRCHPIIRFPLFYALFSLRSKARKSFVDFLQIHLV